MQRLRRSKLSRYARRQLLWADLLIAAKQAGIGRADLNRIPRYLDDKFALRSPQRPDPQQRPGSYFPGLSATAVYDTARFAWVPQLEPAAPAIRDEFLALRRKGLLKPHPQTLADAGTWNTYYFYSNGTKYQDHCKECPNTAAILEQIDGVGVAGQAYFSVMTPGTHVKPHCGPTNTRIRCHLGLQVSEASEIRVASDFLKWPELQCIVFDDSFEHEVWIRDEERAVLIIDLWHPELSPTERWALTRLANMSGRKNNYRKNIEANR